MAREAGIGTRDRTMFEALSTMWRSAALPTDALLARASLWSRKKLLSEALTVGPPADGKARVESLEPAARLGSRLISEGSGKQHSTIQLTSPGDERGSEPCQVYRQRPTVTQRRYLCELGNRLRLSGNGVGQSAANCHRRDGAPVVVRGWESQPHGEGGQSGPVPVQSELSRRADV